MKTQTTIRVEEESYAQAKEILSKMGLSYSQAVGVFNNMIVLNNGLPFELKIPSDVTLQSINELESGGGENFSTFYDMLNDLENVNA